MFQIMLIIKYKNDNFNYSIKINGNFIWKWFFHSFLTIIKDNLRRVLLKCTCYYIRCINNFSVNIFVTEIYNLRRTNNYQK
jgi:hypothetical protein